MCLAISKVNILGHSIIPLYLLVVDAALTYVKSHKLLVLIYALRV